MAIVPLRWDNGVLHLLDQRKLPLEEVWVVVNNYNQVADAISAMMVRGAPAIGIVAAYGMALAASSWQDEDADQLQRHLRQVAGLLKATRPTAVNLAWAVDRVLNRVCDHTWDVATICRVVTEEACAIHQEDLAMNYRLGEWGQQLIAQHARVLTHCNAGALATAGYGTALGVLRAAHACGKLDQVYVDETRPLLQGARLTAWELVQEGIPATLITDSMAGYLMQRGEVDLVIVGADRIAANGDVANKVGTYSLAVLAHYHGIPFYVAAPSSTVDLNLATGQAIPIEERHADEVRMIGTVMVATPQIPVYNPAFDVTPHQLISALITDRGLVYPPYDTRLQALFRPAEGGKAQELVSGGQDNHEQDIN